MSCNLLNTSFHTAKSSKMSFQAFLVSAHPQRGDYQSNRRNRGNSGGSERFGSFWRQTHSLYTPPPLPSLPFAPRTRSQTSAAPLVFNDVPRRGHSSKRMLLSAWALSSQSKHSLFHGSVCCIPGNMHSGPAYIIAAL